MDFAHFTTWQLLIFVAYIAKGIGLAGMRQRDLIKWYVAQQNEENKYWAGWAGCCYNK